MPGSYEPFRWDTDHERPLLTMRNGGCRDRALPNALFPHPICRMPSASPKGMTAWVAGGRGAQRRFPRTGLPLTHPTPKGVAAGWHRLRGANDSRPHAVRRCRFAQSPATRAAMPAASESLAFLSIPTGWQHRSRWSRSAATNTTGECPSARPRPRRASQPAPNALFPRPPRSSNTEACAHPPCSCLPPCWWVVPADPICPQASA